MTFTRRRLIQSGAALSLAPQVIAKVDTRPVLKSDEHLPVIGMGTWLTFDIPLAGSQLPVRKKVLEAFFAQGGGMIDSSPMYGRAEAVMGHLMAGTDWAPKLFSATKIWTPLAGDGPRQLEQSLTLWQRPQLDMMHVHNLLQWRAHLKTLQAAKEAGQVRYIGLTTSHGRRHEKLVELMKSQDIDAVQFSYNIANREAEKRLLPTARDQGLAVIINRPFMTGALFRRVKGRPLPGFATEIGISSWAEYFLKFVISHPAVTCVIPATRRVDHMLENMKAGTGPVPDQSLRKKMIRYFDSL